VCTRTRLAPNDSIVLNLQSLQRGIGANLNFHTTPFKIHPPYHLFPHPGRAGSGRTRVRATSPAASGSCFPGPLSGVHHTAGDRRPIQVGSLMLAARADDATGNPAMTGSTAAASRSTSAHALGSGGRFISVSL
jgi:hypothetical protein